MRLPILSALALPPLLLLAACGGSDPPDPQTLPPASVSTGPATHDVPDPPPALDARSLKRDGDKALGNLLLDTERHPVDGRQGIDEFPAPIVRCKVLSRSRGRCVITLALLDPANPGESLIPRCRSHVRVQRLIGREARAAADRYPPGSQRLTELVFQQPGADGALEVRDLVRIGECRPR